MHHDNASVQYVNKTKSFLASENIELETHPANRLEQAQRYFFIFSKNKELIRGLTVFTGQEEAVIAFNQRVGNIPSDQWSSYFQICFERLKK